MRKSMRFTALALAGMLGLLSGCGSTAAGERQIIRIGHNQSTNHPTHIALTAFEDFVEEKLGDKYNIEVFPSELLGSQNEMVQLTQTGAIHFCVASNSLLETFSKGAVVYTPEEFVESLVGFFEMNFFSAEDQKEFLEDSYHCETLEELKAIAERGELHADDTTNGFYEGYPYVIEYCL